MGGDIQNTNLNIILVKLKVAINAEAPIQHI